MSSPIAIGSVVNSEFRGAYIGEVPSDVSMLLTRLRKRHGNAEGIGNFLDIANGFESINHLFKNIEFESRVQIKNRLFRTPAVNGYWVVSDVPDSFDIKFARDAWISSKNNVSFEKYMRFDGIYSTDCRVSATFHSKYSKIRKNFQQ